MKKSVRIIGLILALLLAASGGYCMGRKSVKPVLQDTFYATVEEIRDNSILVQGLEINDINKRWEFQLFISGDTQFVWRGIPVTMDDLKKGDLISVTYTGLIQETSPAVINEVLLIQYLGDEMDPM